MKKKTSLIITAICFFVVNTAAYSQDYFFFGANAGAFASVPTDWDAKAFFHNVYNPGPLNPDQNYRNFMYEQYDYFCIAPALSLLFGYSTKYFSIQSGIEGFFNINENFLIKKTISQKDPTATVSYIYSSLHIPLQFDLYFLHFSKLKIGISLGPYFSIPLGDINKEWSGDYIFQPQSPKTTSVAQTLSSGAKIGLLSELSAGKNAFTFEIGYMHELFNGEDSLFLNAMTSSNGKANIAAPEQKITVLSGVQITIGYKFRIELNSDSSGNIKSSDISVGAAKYYMIVGGQVEGPLTINDLVSLIDKNLLNKDSMLWKKGMTNWAEAFTFKELAPLLPENSGR
ncbi:MAG: DUF4339 domain-containing protein [Spirochaetaceae bacterium]|jgi:hypothetical protein|nr:DUF4339 domain-containing protein [Spirochaetaceae bacterium]